MEPTHKLEKHEDGIGDRKLKEPDFVVLCAVLKGKFFILEWQTKSHKKVAKAKIEGLCNASDQYTTTVPSKMSSL